MKKLAYIVCASLFLAVPAFAQSNAAAPAGDEQGAGSGQGNSKMKEIVQSCRKQAHSQGLTPRSHEMQQAVMQCVGKDHPRLAKVLGCRMEAMDKGMKPKSDEMKSFIKDCMHKSS